MRIYFFVPVALGLVVCEGWAENLAKMSDASLVSGEGTYSIKDFHFSSGETLPELKIHYRTLGKTDFRRRPRYVAEFLGARPVGGQS